MEIVLRLCVIQVKMTKLTLEMLRDINKDTIDYRPNFDETLKEPVVLLVDFKFISKWFFGDCSWNGY